MDAVFAGELAGEYEVAAGCSNAADQGLRSGTLPLFLAGRCIERR
jgi:hypothetical protein